MENIKLRKAIARYGEENDAELVLFDNPYFDQSITGISYDNRVIYDYDLMVEEMSKDDEIDPEEAIEFIEYNTLRSLPYIENPPIIINIRRDALMYMYGDDDEEENNEEGEVEVDGKK